MNSASPNFVVPSEIPRRRNGRPQACEPCRRRKVACDHRLPICSRCIRKSTPQSCRYLIQGQLVTPALPSGVTRSQSAELLNERQPREPTGPNPTTLSPSTLEDLSPPDENVGYLGATSFPEFFRETQKHLDYVVGPEPVRDGLAGKTENNMTLAKMGPDAAAFEAAFALLRLIPTKEAAQFLLRRNVNPNDAWCRLALDRLHATLWSALGHFLEGERSNEAMSQLAMLLFQNSSKPLKEDFSDPDQWFEAFSGANFRWEGLGILFTFWMFGSASLTENGTVEQRKWLGHYNRKNLMQKYKDGATRSVYLCRLTSCNNTMMVYLLHMHSLAESLITGDTGRPPLVSSKLCSTPLPLDVSDESLLNLKVRPHRLDKDGWNVEGKNHPVTFLRAAYIIAGIRSEILEIVLQAPHVTTQHNFDAMRKRELDIFSLFPPGLQFKNEDFTNPSVDAPTLYIRLLTRLEHLSNLFFIERLSYRGSILYTPQMLEISLEMITLTLSFWTQQNRLEGLQGDYEWLVMLHAAPAAGILCMELLKQPSSTEPPTMTTITKPMIIKQLSLLIGFLEWIGPGAPGAHLCNSIKTVVERVMEQALNPAIPRPITQQEFDMTWDTSLPEDMSDFNFGLLDTFDWLRLPPNTI
ncbi:hypothetical protein TrVFT333_007798 [Trichoderma virens FT-333]|nr:hypothetical protein TrVFT333_007798 [Trichoderma virens FT-333]